ncbi:MAG: MATE family efflux transporter [Acutalibacteraceae bacterium]|nr:MATE family efflux transporter [Acutalibacteraceae bacterium]
MNALKNENIFKLFMRFTIPSFVIVLVSGSYSIVDGIFLGQALGTVGNASNSYIFIIYAMINAVSCLVSQGTSPLISLKMGAGENKKVEKLWGTSIWLTLVTSIITSLIFMFSLKGFFGIMNIESQYHPYIYDYYNLFLLCTPIYFLGHTFLYCIRSQGLISTVLKINIVAFVVNLITGCVFIKFLDWGFVGSALSTILANLSICIISFLHFRKTIFKIKLKNIRFEKNDSLNILSTGLSVFISRFCSVALMILYNYICMKYAGETGIASLSIVSTLYRYIITIIDALTTGVQPIIGYNYGAKQYDRVKKSLKYAIIVGTVVSTLIFAVVQLFSVQIIQLFNSEDSQLWEFGSNAIRSVMLVIFLQGVVSMGTYYYQYIGEKKKSTILVVIRQIILQVPLSIILPMYLGSDGLWTSFWISDLIVFVIIAVCLTKSLLQINNKQKLVAKETPST